MYVYRVVFCYRMTGQNVVFPVIDKIIVKRFSIIQFHSPTFCPIVDLISRALQFSSGFLMFSDHQHPLQML